MASAARASASTWSTSTVARAVTGSGPEVVAVGRIGPARGVRGDVFVEPWTDDPDRRFSVGTVLRTEPTEAGPLTVAASSSASGKLVVHFAGVGDRFTAEALRGVRLVVPVADRPPI